MSEGDEGVRFEQGEGTVARLRNRLAEAKGKLDIIIREGTGEPPDSLGADYGGTDWEKSDEVQAIRAERSEAAAWRTACKVAQTERLRLMRAVLGVPHPQPFPDEIGDPFGVALAAAGNPAEELAYVRRELAEMRGQDASEETSGTLAIYESFKTALEPFGHENVNVRARIEGLVTEWKYLREQCRKPLAADKVEIEKLRTQILELEGTRDNLTESVRQMEQLILPLDPDPRPIKKMSEVIADVPKRVAEILERTRGFRCERDAALMLLADALIQLRNAGVSTFLLKPAVSDGAKRDLIRVLQLSMGEDTVEDAKELLRESTDAIVARGLSMSGQMEQAKKPGVGMGVVCFQDGRILLGKRHPSLDGGGQWELPGGSLEWGETWPGAARREVKEETGITDLRNYRFLTAKEDHRYEDAKHNAIIFVRFDARGHAVVKELDKSTEWGWYLLDDLPDGPMFPALRELLTVDRNLLA